MNPLARIQEKEKIALVDNYAEEPSKIVEDLDRLNELLGEREAEVFRCTCEDDDEHPRGYMEHDTNAYIHADDCPSGWAYHYDVLLRGLARHFREDHSVALTIANAQAAALRRGLSEALMLLDGYNVPIPQSTRQALIVHGNAKIAGQDFLDELAMWRAKANEPVDPPYDDGLTEDERHAIG